MTAALEFRAPSSAADSLDGLISCTPRFLGTRLWWTQLGDALDALRFQLSGADLTGLAAQVVADAPELAASALRLLEIDDATQAEASRLRQGVTEMSGRTPEVMVVREAVRALVTRVRRLDRLSEDLLHEAYQRDFGGE